MAKASAKPVNHLYYGDNIDVLRDHSYFPDESVNLVYLDPPFNSNKDYNAFFQQQDGRRSTAQIKAFTDTWKWDVSAADSYNELSNAEDRSPMSWSASTRFWEQMTF